MPSLQVNDAGTWRNLVNVYVNDVGTWRQIMKVFVNDAGTWRQVFAAASVTVDNVTRFGSRIGSGSVTSNIVTATGLPAGGTYSWRKVSGSATTSATSAGTAATAFNCPSVSVGVDEVSTWVCDYTVNGTTVTSPSVTVTLTAN